MTRSLAVVALLSAAGCAAPAQSAAPPPKTAGAAVASSEAPPPPKRICRMERPLGSNIAHMVCRDQDTTDAQRTAAQDAIRLAPKSGLSPPNN